MKKPDTKQLEKIANQVRQDIIKMLLEAGAGHPAGSLGAADIITALYFSILNYDPKNPNWEDRDRFILSCGHICPARYAAMARAGYFSLNELKKFGKLGGILQGHPDKRFLSAVETTSGPLGSGLAQACGIAYAARLDASTGVAQARFRIFCLVSDGEHDEGNHWEAVLFAGRNSLSNLTLIVDRNNIQIDGHTEDVMPLEPLVEKYKAFNWSVVDIDGHNFEEIIGAVNKARAIYENPTVIVAHTIAGKGIDFIENRFEWHSKPIDKEQARQALKELRTLGNRIKEYGE